jgi:protein phosphatase 1G
MNGHFRINGNLNLSRAVGDLKYKQNKQISRAAQIITAEPDVIVQELVPEDEFMVIACDGVWDVMSNDAVLAFVRQRMGKMRLSRIAEELMDNCMAEDPKKTSGLGGDNMTAMVVQINPGAAAPAAAAPAPAASQ